jgi:hypothetical protein
LGDGFKPEPAGVGGQPFGGGSRVFAAIKRANGINGAVAAAVFSGSQKKTGTRQLAAGPATDAVAGSVFSDRQNTCQRPFNFGFHRKPPVKRFGNRPILKKFLN